MPASTNILQFNPGSSNQEDDASYAADTLRTGGIATDSTFPSVTANKMFYQWSTFLAAFANMMVAKGYSINDTSLSTLQGILANVITNADGPPAVPLGSLLSAISPTWNFASAPWSSYNVNAAGGNFVGTLPAANALGGAIVIVTKVDATGNTVSIAPHGTDTISGSGSDKVISSQFSNYWFQSDGITNWTVIAKI